MAFHLFRTGEAVSTNRKIFRAAVIVGFFGLMAKLMGSAKEIIVAQWFGRSDGLDSFLIAFLVCSFTVMLLVGALDSALIPVLVEIRQKEGTAGTQKLLSSMLLLIVLGLIGIALLLGVLATYYLPWIAHGFSAQKLYLTRQLLYLLLPFLFFRGIALFITTALSGHERFGLPSAVPLVTPLVTVVFIFLAAIRWGTFTLAAGAVAGSVLEAGFLYYLLWRQGVTLSLHWEVAGPAVRQVLSGYAPLLAAAFLMGSTSVVDQAMAAMLPGGSVAALSYGNKLIGAIVAIGGTALNTAALPYFSKMAAGRDWEGCRHTLKRYIALTALATIPFTLLLIAFSRLVIRVLFQRGAFTGIDTAVVSWVQACYAIQLPFYMWSMLFVRFLCAVRWNRVFPPIAAINLTIDIVLNLVLMRIWGVAGIALSTSIVNIVCCLMLALISMRFLAKERSATFTAIQAQQAGR